MSNNCSHGRVQPSDLNKVLKTNMPNALELSLITISDSDLINY